MNAINMSDGVKRERNHEAILTVRSLMQGKEVGAIIGRGGDLVRQLRDESGAKIYISNASVPDRIVTVTGTLECVGKAYQLITSKIQQYFVRLHSSLYGAIPPLTFKLIVPAAQCGSIIGKAGVKIKEIREQCEVSIQVSSEMLPNSTERVVTIIGWPNNVTRCIVKICRILLESSPRGNIIAYNPHKSSAKSLLAGFQDKLGFSDLQTFKSTNPLASLFSGLSALLSGGMNAAAITAIASSQLRPGNRRSRFNNVQTQEIMVPNEFIGSIIGKGGSKIANIRQSSGANIRISGNEDVIETDDGLKRRITITGTLDAITLAKGLINISVDLQKVNMEDQNSSNSNEFQSQYQSYSSSSSPSPLPIASLMSKPTSYTNLNEYSDDRSSSRFCQTTSAHHTKSYSPRFRNNISDRGFSSGDRMKFERNKYAPY